MSDDLSDEQRGAIFLGITVVVVVIGIVTFAFVKITKAQAVYPLSIPTECVELAQRENRPLTIKDKKHALAEKARLFLMKHDPLVDQCRAAVKRVESQIKAMKNETKQ